MNPVKFKGYNTVYAKDQPEYRQLPVHRTKDGDVTSCWKLTIRERIAIMFGKNICISVLTFNQPLQPILPYVGKPDIEEAAHGNK